MAKIKTAVSVLFVGVMALAASAIDQGSPY